MDLSADKFCLTLKNWSKRDRRVLLKTHKDDDDDDDDDEDCGSRDQDAWLCSVNYFVYIYTE